MVLPGCCQLSVHTHSPTTTCLSPHSPWIQGALRTQFLIYTPILSRWSPNHTSVPERVGLEEFSHLPHTGPTLSLDAFGPHCSFQHLGLTWAACHSYSGILGRDSVGTPCRTSGLHRRFSALSTSSCYLFPSSFLVPCYFFCFYQCHIWFYSSVSPHSSSISIFLMSVVCLLFYLSTLISFMFL